MNAQDQVFTLYTRVLDEQVALGVLLTRGGSERFELFPLDGRDEEDVFLQEVVPLLHRRVGVPSGQIIRLQGETMLSMSGGDHGYQLRPMGEGELDWHGSLFEDWASRLPPKRSPRVAAPAASPVVVPAPISPPVKTISAETPRAEALPKDAGAGPEQVRRADPCAAGPATPDASRKERLAEDVEALRALIRSLFQEPAAHADLWQEQMSGLQRDLASLSAGVGQVGPGLEALKARIDLTNQRLLAIERDKVDFSRRFDDIEKSLREIRAETGGNPAAKVPHISLRIARTVLSTLLVVTLCLTAFLCGILLSDPARTFLQGGSFLQEPQTEPLEERAHTGADWAGTLKSELGRRITRNLSD